MEQQLMHPKVLHSKSMNHLGLIAGMFDQLEIEATIDKFLPDTGRLVSPGKIVKAMVLNGLGFVTQPLYLTPKFFKDKPIKSLLGEEIEAAHLNDDALGDVLDMISTFDPSLLFSAISAHSSKVLGLKTKSAHLDSTSFHVDGRYDHDEKSSEIKITKGYTRDHRPDLNQVVLNLIVSNQNGIPLLMEAASGNSEDKKNFRSIIDRHIQNLTTQFGTDVFVADSALYTRDTLALFQAGHTFISRVPETSKEAKEAIIQAITQPFISLDDNYRYQAINSSYGGIEQRWLIIQSKHAENRVKTTVNKRYDKLKALDCKCFEQLQSQKFSCQEDAKKALDTAMKQMKVSEFKSVEIIAIMGHKKRGRPKAGQMPEKTNYQIQGILHFESKQIQDEIDRKSCFILATNAEESRFSVNDVLQTYKAQINVEKGFKFMKNPEFFTSSLNLKKPSRIMSLMMIMTLCLLVYAALEREIRLQLKLKQLKVKNQIGKATDMPTTRWIFHVFLGIHLLYFDIGIKQILNLNEQHTIVLEALGEHYWRYYR